MCDVTLCQDLHDIVSFAGPDPAVTGEESTSGSTLCSKSTIGREVLTEHLDMDLQFLDIIGGVDVLQDVVGLPLEPMKRDVEETPSSVYHGIQSEFRSWYVTTIVVP